MDFFSQCQTKEDAKKVFKKLCKFFHPDKGGDDELMIELKKQYDGWNPSTRIEGNEFNSSMINMYEKKIHDLTNTVYALRNQLDELKRVHSYKEAFHRDEVNMHNKIVRELKKEKEDLQDKMEDQMEDLRGLIEGMVKKKDKMTLADKVRFVLGYD